VTLDSELCCRSMSPCQCKSFVSGSHPTLLVLETLLVVVCFCPSEEEVGRKCEPSLTSHSSNH
jgi:hypothetical protein